MKRLYIALGLVALLAVLCTVHTVYLGRLTTELSGLLAQAQEQARQIVAKARTEAEQRRERVLRESQRELRELTVAAVKKLTVKADTDLFDQFLNLAEGGGAHEDH